MTDYNWYAPEAVEVAADGIRTEAKKWFELSDRMATVSNVAASQSLGLGAFLVTDITGPVTASDLKAAYDKMYEWLNSLFKEAVTEFDAFGEALKKCAGWYETSDANSVQNFDEIAKS